LRNNNSTPPLPLFFVSADSARLAVWAFLQVQILKVLVAHAT
jgi:hypothetical protein